MISLGTQGKIAKENQVCALYMYINELDVQGQTTPDGPVCWNANIKTIFLL